MPPLIGTTRLPTIALTAARSAPNNLITWVPSNGNVHDFNLQRQVDGGGFVDLSSPAAGDRSVNDTNASADGTYQYRIRARRGNRYGDWSNTGQVIVNPASGSLLTESDFTYLGSFKLPVNTGGVWGATGSLGSFTWRNGRILFTTHKFDQYFVECNVPTLRTSPPYNTASVYKNFGITPYGSLRVAAGATEQWTTALFVDPQGDPDVVYWNWLTHYGPPPFDALMTAYSTLDDASSTGTAHANYRVGDIHCQRSCGVICRMPDAFVSANCPGKPFMYGSGSPFMSTNFTSSWGPAFFPTAIPDVENYASGSALPTINAVYFDSTNRAIRSDDYRPIDWGMFTATSDSQVTLWSAIGDANYNGREIYIYQGAGAGQTVTLSFVSGRTYNVSPSFSPVPDTTTSRYEIPALIGNPGFDYQASGGVGRVISIDKAMQGTVWIDGAKQGILQMWGEGRGRYYYHYAYPDERRTRIARIFDPADLALAISEDIEHDAIAPSSQWEWVDPATESQYRDPCLLNVGAYDQDKDMRLSWDPNTRLLATLWPGAYDTGFGFGAMVSIWEVAN